MIPAATHPAKPAPNLRLIIFPCAQFLLRKTPPLSQPTMAPRAKKSLNETLASLADPTPLGAHPRPIALLPKKP